MSCMHPHLQPITPKSLLEYESVCRREREVEQGTRRPDREGGWREGGREEEREKVKERNRETDRERHRHRENERESDRERV